MLTEKQIKEIEKAFGMKRELNHFNDYTKSKGLNIENYFYFGHNRNLKDIPYTQNYIEICTLKGEETIQLEFAGVSNKWSIGKMKEIIKILEGDK